MNIIPSKRIQDLPPYVFLKIDELKQKALQAGKTLYSLGIGDPDLPAPSFVLEALTQSAAQLENQKYPSYVGKQAFREACAFWIEKRFGVTLNPQQQILSLIGSKEGIAHIPLAFVNPSDGVLVPEIGYPIYYSSVLFAGGNPLLYSMDPNNHYYPDFAQLESLVQQHRNVKMMFLNYPNNPTAATAELGFFEQIVSFAKKYNIIVCHDNAYCDIYFEQKKPVSILQAKGALEVACEFHSLSKTFNMSGFRVGFVAGNEKILQALATIKTNIDSGIFNACQDAGIRALHDTSLFGEELRHTYQQRRDVLVPALQKFGIQCSKPDATFYVWGRVPHGFTSESFVIHLLNEYGIICTPGSGFGKAAEGFVRFTLCSDLATLKKVAYLLNSKDTYESFCLHKAST